MSHSQRGSIRARSKEIVSLSPGIHLRRLQKVLGASFSTTRYHVDGLERDGEIMRLKDGKYDRLYPTGTSEQMKSVFATLQGKTARRILGEISAGNEGKTAADLSENIGISRSTVCENLDLLARANLTARSVALDGRAVYVIKDRETVSQLLAAFEKNLLSIATDGFIDLWDL